MCGIFCLISKTQEPVTDLLKKFDAFKLLLANRGPNSLNYDCFDTPTYKLFFAASVLWLQGEQITVQPLKTNNSVFVYNGDIFGGWVNSNLEIGDTVKLFNILNESDNIMETLEPIGGPYAFIYYNKLKNKVYFGRDKFGRRSLLVGINNNEIILTSVAKKGTEFTFIELPSLGIFSVDLKSANWKIYPWRRKNKNFDEKLIELERFLNERILNTEVDIVGSSSFRLPNEKDLQILNQINNISTENLFEFLCYSPYLEKIEKLRILLEDSLRKRILSQRKFCQDCYNRKDCSHCITGVLFSGGVDCAILALLADKFIEKRRPIDLINVAFEKNKSFDTPDRITSRETFKELQNLQLDRNWNLVEVNVSKEELSSLRHSRISDLIYPLDSVLDDSLGCALWFASRASTSSYISPCRTLLVGMGADELFGGYTRHRAAFKDDNFELLHQVLEEDWQNLPYRNLGRDDRVASDHGRQLRTPYLDEGVVEFVQGLNCWEKTLPSKNLPQGMGEKILLRCLAYSLGLKKAAVLKKRALQFGSRIANPKEKGYEKCERLNF